MGRPSTPALYRKLPYDTLRDFIPVSLVAVCALAQPFAGAQAYPSKPVRFIVAESGYPEFESGAWQGIVIRAGLPEEFTAFMRAGLDKWSKVIKMTGVRND